MLMGERKKRWLCIVVVIFCSSGLAKGGTDLIETTFDDPSWVLVTSDVILREDICTLGWYEKVFNPCYLPHNRYWKLEPCAKEGRAFTMGQISEPNWLDSIYVREGFEFRLYYNAEEPNNPNDLLPASPRMAGPQYVTLTWWRDNVPPPEGFEPGTFFVAGGEGDLAEYSVIIYAPNKCQIVNGSFEDNGYISDIMVKEPNGWDVNMPTNKFKGYVYNKWVTDGSYNLTLYTQWVKLDANDTAIVSQQVDLTDANGIIFDVNLATDLFQWDPNKVRAIVLIDNDLAWDSNDISSGGYRGQVCKVDKKYRDGNLHTLSFGMRVNVSEKLWRTYLTHWDFIRCSICCGEESLPEDFSGDGCVNFIDFAMLAGYWLEQNPPSQYDLAENGIVDANDLGAFVDKWLECSNQQE